jgi:hypothetical protein
MLKLRIKGRENTRINVFLEREFKFSLKNYGVEKVRTTTINFLKFVNLVGGEGRNKLHVPIPRRDADVRNNCAAIFSLFSVKLHKMPKSRPTLPCRRLSWNLQPVGLISYMYLTYKPDYTHYSLSS